MGQNEMLRALLKTSFLKIPPDCSISALSTILMNTFKSDCVCLDLKQSDGIFYQKQVSRSALNPVDEFQLRKPVRKSLGGHENTATYD